jgi:hypothetical protein
VILTGTGGAFMDAIDAPGLGDLRSSANRAVSSPVIAVFSE